MTNSFKVLCYGDSNTYGYIPENGQRYSEDKRWSGILKQYLSKDGIEIIEDGVVGRTTEYEDVRRPGRNGLAILPTSLKLSGPIDYLVLMLGTNDCKTVYGLEPEEIGKGIEKNINLAKEKYPDIKILLVSPIHLGEEVWKENFDPEFNEHSVEVSKGLARVYKDIADEYDLDYLDASAIASPSPADQEHLTIDGHRRLSEEISKKIKKYYLPIDKVGK